MFSRLQDLFTRSNKSTARRRRECNRQIGVESLEPRQLMTVSWHGGAVVHNVEVQDVFLGRDWSTNPNLNQQTGALEGFNKFIVNSSYIDMLTNAGYSDTTGRIGHGSFTTGIIATEILNNSNQWTEIDKTKYLQQATIEKTLQAEISSRYLTQPDANRLYVVYVERNVAVITTNGSEASDKGYMGYHTYFAGHNASGAPAYIHYALIAYPGGTYNPTSSSAGFKNDFDQLTTDTSHELAEGVTDPNMNGWYAYSGADYIHEIGDLAVGHYARVGPYCVQAVVNKTGQLLYPTGATYYAFTGGYASLQLTVSQNGSTAPNIAVGLSNSSISTLNVSNGSQLSKIDEKHTPTAAAVSAELFLESSSSQLTAKDRHEAFDAAFSYGLLS